MKTKFLIFCTLISGLFFVSGCKKDDPNPINIFSVDDDIALGEKIDAEIKANPQEYPILDSVQYANAYAHLYRIRNTILASGKLNYADRFKWKCRIIKNDTVINAFCVSGGNIYVYTGIIKLLSNEAEFAGVMGHEMAHADLRHTTDQLTLNYGVDILLGIVLGDNPTQLEQIAAGLATGLGSLAFSRNDEYQADKYAVKYLYPTEYDAASLGDFFVIMQSQPQPPTFLSTHPSMEARLTKINEEFQALGGIHGQTFPERYQDFKNSLP